MPGHLRGKTGGIIQMIQFDRLTFRGNHFLNSPQLFYSCYTREIIACIVNEDCAIVPFTVSLIYQNVVYGGCCCLGDSSRSCDSS